MLGATVQWLDRVGPMIFWTCAIALITIDTAAVATVIGTRSRELVNRWTGAIVIANTLLLGAGVGVPAMMYVTKVAVQAVAPSARLSISPAVAADER